MKERDGREVALAASELKEGQLSPFIPSSSTSPTSSGGGLLVYLAKKQPADEKQFEQEKTQLAEEIVSQNREALFHQWIKLRRAAAGIALPESRSPAAAQSAPAPL
jgi:hypothetical protein